MVEGLAASYLIPDSCRATIEHLSFISRAGVRIPAGSPTITRVYVAETPINYRITEFRAPECVARRASPCGPALRCGRDLAGGADGRQIVERMTPAEPGVN